jgi:hypothetical protein
VAERAGKPHRASMSRRSSTTRGVVRRTLRGRTGGPPARRARARAVDAGLRGASSVRRASGTTSGRAQLKPPASTWVVTHDPIRSHGAARSPWRPRERAYHPSRETAGGRSPPARRSDYRRPPSSGVNLLRGPGDGFGSVENRRRAARAVDDRRSGRRRCPSWSSIRGVDRPLPRPPPAGTTRGTFWRGRVVAVEGDGERGARLARGAPRMIASGLIMWTRDAVSALGLAPGERGVALAQGDGERDVFRPSASASFDAAIAMRGDRRARSLGPAGASGNTIALVGDSISAVRIVRRRGVGRGHAARGTRSADSASARCCRCGSQEREVCSTPVCGSWARAGRRSFAQRCWQWTRPTSGPVGRSAPTFPPGHAGVDPGR